MVGDRLRFRWRAVGYERNRSNWPAFLALLDQTRQAMPQGKHLSVAAPLLYWRFPFTWTKDYFGEVAKHCDQIAVMGYDSGCLFPWSYVDLMSEQCTGIAPKMAASNPNCKLIIGVPTYQRGDIPMHDFVETLKLALIGVRNGTGKLTPGSKQSFDGVAVFVRIHYRCRRVADVSATLAVFQLNLCHKIRLRQA